MINKNTTIVILIFTIAAVLAGAGWYYFLTQNKTTEAPTTNAPDLQANESNVEINKKDGLKLYRNEEWGFEFRYPADWEIRQPAFGSAVSKFNMAVEPPSPHLPDPIRINILPTDWIEQAHEKIKARGFEPSGIEIDGVSGVKYEYTSEGLPQIDYFFPREDYWIVVGGKKEYEDILNKVIASFKFLK